MSTRIPAHKGLDLLVEALATSAWADDPKAELAIAGPAAQRLARNDGA